EHPYNITYFVNATLNWNNSEPAGEDTIRLDFNGSHVWTGTYKLQNDSVTGNWTVNITAYTRDRIYLDHAYRYINVTDLYFTNVAFNNSVTVETFPLWGNVTVQNARQDQFVTGANISCVYGDGIHVRPSNITAFNSARFPGVYSFNFTAPPADRYTLRCNATKAGNLGQNQADFTTEVAELVPNVTLQPPSVSLPNVTLLWGQNFTYTAEINNTRNGTAYSTNISIDVPVGWTANRTFARCGGADFDLDPGETCSRVIEIHAPNATVPANYSVNPIGSYNNTTEQLRTDVEENPLLKVNDTAVNGSVGGGQTVQVGDFLIESLGNFNLSSVNMTCPQGTACQDFTVTFDPANFSTLDEGSNQSINVSVFVPKGYQPGNYSGTINASAATTFDTLELNINVINTTQVETNVTDTQVVADTVTRQHGENITFRVNATNIGEAFAYGANISLELPQRWRSNDSTASLGEMDVGNFSVRRLWVTVPNSTEPGNYTINATTNWTNPDSTHDTSRDSITVWVQENPVQNVTTRQINGTVPAGKNLTIGNLTVDSIGNFNITNVQYRCFPRSGTVCDNFTTRFRPTSIPTLEDGENRSVDVNVSVPTGYQAGNYTGIVRVNSSGGAENLTLNVEVPPTRTWELRLWDQGENVNFCQQAAEQGSGLVCDNVTIINTGNTFINFTAIPRSANNTTITQQNFSL
ncbi:MAG: NEW3 domain-containing protein, partial [Candidatus Nanohaloarchaea archaeon]|nr:NEW3 domain-containing protein [Candidatus Nanohaloarchaea archaeon]